MAWDWWLVKLILRARMRQLWAWILLFIKCEQGKKLNRDDKRWFEHDND